MDLIRSKYHFTGRRPAFAGALAAFFLVLAGSGVATAQQDIYMDFSLPNVTVDLSVIDNGGYGSVPGAAATVPGAPPGIKLLLPGKRAPTSVLHVPTLSGRPLVMPKKQKTVQAAAGIPVPVVQQAPVPAPKPAEIAVAPKPPVAPAKPAAPTVIAPAAKKSPPPAPVVAPVARVAKSEAPKAPPPPPEPKKKKKKKKTAAPEQASLPPATAKLEPGQAMRVAFGAKQTKLPAAAKEGLAALAEKMKGRENIRLQLMAYAGGPSLSSSRARRMSLSRALAIRSFLIESGVRSTRIDVRALGNKTTEDPVNRVDLNVTER